jgi:hypothetical protein
MRFNSMCSQSNGKHVSHISWVNSIGIKPPRHNKLRMLHRGPRCQKSVSKFCKTGFYPWNAGTTKFLPRIMSHLDFANVNIMENLLSILASLSTSLGIFRLFIVCVKIFGRSISVRKSHIQNRNSHSRVRESDGLVKQ